MAPVQQRADVRFTVLGDDQLLGLVAEDVLHSSELAAYEGLPIYRRADFLGGRFALKSLVPNADMRETVVSAAGGKPHIRDAALYCSISHTKGYAAAAISSRAVGIDVEMIRERHPALLRSIATLNEVRALMCRYSAKLVPTIAWTIKEAAAKADTYIHPLHTYVIAGGDRIVVQRGGRRWIVSVRVAHDHVSAVSRALYV